MSILQSDELHKFKEKHGSDIPILVEGRVGIITAKDDNGNEDAQVYIQQLKNAGASGAIVGGGLVEEGGASLLESY